MKIISLAIFLFSIYCLIVYPIEDEYILTIPIMLVCLYLWFYIDCFKIEITENEIIKYGIKKRRIVSYMDVLRLELYTDYIIIKSRNIRIHIGTDLVKKKEAIAFILDKLKSRKEDLKIKGEKSLINKFKNYV